MATLYSPKIPTDGLLSHLDAENIKSYVSGSSFWKNMAMEGSGNGYVATYATAATQTYFDTYPKAVRIVQGAGNTNNIFSQSLSFNENFTLLCWYKPQATASGIANQTESPGIIQIGAYAQNSSLTVWDWSVSTPGSHKVSTYVNNGSVWSHNLQSTASYSDAVWCNKYHHVALTFSGSAGKWNLYNLYVDGTLQTSINFSAPFPSGSIFNNWITAPAANGGMANNSYAMISTYGRCFSAADVVSHYNATKGRFGV